MADRHKSPLLGVRVHPAIKHGLKIASIRQGRPVADLVADILRTTLIAWECMAEGDDKPYERFKFDREPGRDEFCASVGISRRMMRDSAFVVKHGSAKLQKLFGDEEISKTMAVTIIRQTKVHDEQDALIDLLPPSSPPRSGDRAKQRVLARQRAAASATNT